MTVQVPSLVGCSHAKNVTSCQGMSLPALHVETLLVHPIDVISLLETLNISSDVVKAMETLGKGLILLSDITVWGVLTRSDWLMVQRHDGK